MTTQPLPVSIGSRRGPPDLTRLERVGAESCADEELLALVLGGGTTAHRAARRLIDRFGSLTGVARAHPAELRLAGLAPAVAPRVSAAAEIGVRVARRRPEDPWLIRTPTDAAEPLIDAMARSSERSCASCCSTRRTW
ncbi:MAG: UPF0758 domain-containing protein [Candidatus Limnocylindria bacterium]